MITTKNRSSLPLDIIASTSFTGSSIIPLLSKKSTIYQIGLVRLNTTRVKLNCARCLELTIFNLVVL